jgi:SAM-dependent methyltransferase
VIREARRQASETSDSAIPAPTPSAEGSAAAHDFSDVTEITGSPISTEAFERLVNRYHWAAGYCRDRDVVEAGCGVGPGLGLLAATARTLEAGDYSPPILALAQRHYGQRIPLSRFNAEALPFGDGSKDVIILFEALYYLEQPRKFIAECVRVLRPGGKVLISTANKDLWDFHRSPHVNDYYGVLELRALFELAGFACEFFGVQRADRSPWRQRVLRPVKRAAVLLGLMPQTMNGKRWLKRIVFGREIPMPAELAGQDASYVAPERISGAEADRHHKIIYCAATRVA